MIIFKEPLEETEKFFETNVGKDRLVLLEKALRMIGSFEEGEAIQVIEEEYQKEDSFLYEVKDLNGTSFKFCNFSTRTDIDKNRYSKNYNFIMKQKNSIIVYIYNFYGLTKDEELRISKVSVDLSSNRTLELQIAGNHHNCLRITEMEKKYVLVLHRNSQDEIIRSIEVIISLLAEIETLNLESILLKLKMYQNLVSTFIYINDIRRATINWEEGKISSYSILDENQEIKGNLKGELYRQVKTQLEESNTSSKEIIKSDIKELLKNL